MSSFFIPMLIFLVILYASLKKINVYDSFTEGSTESFGMILKLFPSMLAMIVAVNVFLKSGILEAFISLIEPILKLLYLPSEVLPMAIIRPISGSSSLAILNNILTNYGPDSFLGRLASVMQGSTDTTFYVLTLYFGSVGIKKIRYSLWAGLFADLIGILSSILFVHLFF